ncbi:uncharacterized protein PV09_09612 [Verruconis gallopava]|uniref:FAD-binding FR-type domain-containing protein n=1 Tax=Verruconis gallopava TaxID=253628 RepID=A0A0D1ZX36_9PEZI|nr:uncharacterized protein PV09_09612 [Verruconis gallopava]KIV98594.1 hypothetical protein PV09_09612 [Verruconis gallopava]
MASTRLFKSSIRPRTYGAFVLGSGLFFCAYHVYSSHSPPKARHLNPSTFTPYTLVSRDPVSSSNAVFHLRPQNSDPLNAEAMRLASKTGIWSVQFKQPQLQIARNYTPLPNVDGLVADDELRLLIRREEGGEVSNYLHDLPERSTISVRGPFQECDIPSGVTDVLFLAGGTGIAPALQVARLIGERANLKMHILWANRTREECEGGISDSYSSSDSGWSGWLGAVRNAPHDKQLGVGRERGQIVQLLDSLKSQGKQGQLLVDYFVDEEKKFITPNDVSQALVRRGSGRALILISGPDGFVDYWAGRKEWAGGREVQGALGGKLKEMNLKGWKVIKI